LPGRALGYLEHVKLTERAPVQVALAVLRRAGEDRVGYLAATTTYYGFLSLFPLLLLAVSVLGFTLAGDPAAQAEWAARLSGALPGLEGLVGRNIDAAIEARAAAGAIGLVGLLWSGLGATEAAGYGVSRVFRVTPYQSFVKRKLWSLGSTLTLGVLAIVGLGLVAIVGNLSWGGPWLRVGAVVLAVAVDVSLFVFAYRLLTQRQGPSFRRVVPGAVLAAVLWTGLKVVGTWYVARTVARSAAVYGAFAGTVGVLLLLFLAAQVLLYGAELNAVLIERDEGTDEGTNADEGGGRVSRPKEEGRTNGDRSTASLLKSVAGDTATLVKKEVELAKREILEGVTGKAKAAAGFAVAAVLGLFAVGAVVVTIAVALRIVMPAWAAWLVTAVTLLVLAGGVAAVASARMKRAGFSVDKTKETVKEDVEWARAQLRR
jgi:membrane protein